MKRHEAMRGMSSDYEPKEDTIEQMFVDGKDIS
jgi:hypothetical protein